MLRCATRRAWGWPTRSLAVALRRRASYSFAAASVSFRLAASRLISSSAERSSRSSCSSLASFKKSLRLRLFPLVLPSRTARAVRFEDGTAAGPANANSDLTLLCAAHVVLRICWGSLVMLEADAFLLESNVLGFLVGLGLGIRGPCHVAEAGSFGGGMLSNLDAAGSFSASPFISIRDWDFEPFLFRVKLSLRRIEAPKEDPLASVGLEGSWLAASYLRSFASLCSWGPVSLGCLVFPVLCWKAASGLRYPKSPLVLGREDDMNGLIAFRVELPYVWSVVVGPFW